MTEALQEKLAELSRRFAAQAGAQAAAIRNALARDDRPTMGALAHKLAGAAGMFGQPDVGAAALAVEEMVETGADPRAAAAHLIDLLETL